MNQVLYKNRCKCKEVFFSTKKVLPKRQSEGRPTIYPVFNEANWKTFDIEYKHDLSLEIKFLLNSFQRKYIYYAIDDILYSPNLGLNEREHLLSLLYAPALLLHNRDCIDFFDIWLHDLSINKDLKTNRFLTNQLESSYRITITVFYKTKKIVNTPKSLW